MPFAVRRAQALSPGRRPQPGTGIFFAMREENQCWPCYRRWRPAPRDSVLYCGDDFNHTLNNKLFAFFPIRKATLSKRRCNGDPAKMPNLIIDRKPTDAGIKHQHGGTRIRRCSCQTRCIPVLQFGSHKLSRNLYRTGWLFYHELSDVRWQDTKLRHPTDLHRPFYCVSDSQTDQTRHRSVVVTRTTEITVATVPYRNPNLPVQLILTCVLPDGQDFVGFWHCGST